MNPHFYIMNASCLVNNKSVNVTDAHNEWKGYESTILVCKRGTGGYPEKTSKIFVHGSGIGYNVKPGMTVPYTQDTGNGYRFSGYPLEVENVIDIAEDGTMTGVNNINMTEKRRLWVMK